MALSLNQKKLMLYDLAARTWRQLAEQNIDNPTWSHDDSAVFFHDFVQAGEPIYRLTLATGRIEQVANLHDLRAANAVDYQFAGLTPADVPLLSVRTSVADIYSADLPH